MGPIWLLLDVCIESFGTSSMLILDNLLLLLAFEDRLELPVRMLLQG